MGVQPTRTTNNLCKSQISIEQETLVHISKQIRVGRTRRGKHCPTRKVDDYLFMLLQIASIREDDELQNQ